MYQALADAVLVLHFGVVLFVVGGLLAVLAGNALGWPWVNSRAFRFAHLLAIAVVVAQSWMGATCPLTSLESWLRLRSGQSGYELGFIQHWVHGVLFYEAPTWVFTALYTAFAALVAVTWWRFPPRKSASQGERGASAQTKAQSTRRATRSDA